MNPLGELGQRIREEIPDAELQTEAPAEADGVWLLTVKLGDPVLLAQWQPSKGFGLSSIPSDGFGSIPNERYDELEQAAERAVSLVQERKQHQAPTEPPFAGF